MAGLVLVKGEVSDKAGTLVDPDASARGQREAAVRVSGGRQARRRARYLRCRRRPAARPSTWGPRPGASWIVFCSGAPRGSSPSTSAGGSWTPGCAATRRVHVIEGVNARYLAPETLPWQPDLLTMDVSFISVTKVLPAVVACMAPRYDGSHPHQAPVRGGPEGRGQGRHRARCRRCIAGCCLRPEASSISDLARRARRPVPVRSARHRRERGVLLPSIGWWSKGSRS